MLEKSASYNKVLYQLDCAPDDSFISIEVVIKSLRKQISTNTEAFEQGCILLSTPAEDAVLLGSLCPTYYNGIDLFANLRGYTFFYDFINLVDKSDNTLHKMICRYFLPESGQKETGANFDLRVKELVSLFKQLVRNIRNIDEVKKADIIALQARLQAVQHILQRQLEVNSIDMVAYLKRKNKKKIKLLNQFPVSLLWLDAQFKTLIDYIYGKEDEFPCKDTVMSRFLSGIELQVITEDEFYAVVDAGYEQIKQLSNALRTQIKEFILTVFNLEFFSRAVSFKQAIEEQILQNQSAFIAPYQNELRPIEANEQVVHICPTHYNQVNLFERLQKEHFLAFYTAINFLDTKENLFRELLLGTFLQLFERYDEKLIKALQIEVEEKTDKQVDDIVCGLQTLIKEIRNRFSSILIRNVNRINAELDLVSQEMQSQIIINEKALEFSLETPVDKRFKFVLPRMLYENSRYAVLFNYINVYDTSELSYRSLLADLLDCALDEKQYAELCTVGVLEKIRQVENYAQALKEQLKKAVQATPSPGFSETVVRFFSPKGSRRRDINGLTGSINGEVKVETRFERSVTIEYK